MTESATGRTSAQSPPEAAAGHGAASAREEEPGLIRTETQPAGDSSPGPAAEGPGVAELEDRWRRAVADLDNLRKRYARELGREREAERELVTAAFLPVLDTIDRALEHAEADPRSIADGV